MEVQLKRRSPGMDAIALQWPTAEGSTDEVPNRRHGGMADRLTEHRARQRGAGLRRKLRGDLLGPHLVGRVKAGEAVRETG